MGQIEHYKELKMYEELAHRLTVSLSDLTLEARALQLQLSGVLIRAYKDLPWYKRFIMRHI